MNVKIVAFMLWEFIVEFRVNIFMNAKTMAFMLWELIVEFIIEFRASIFINVKNHGIHIMRIHN